MNVATEYNEKQIQILEVTERLFSEKGFDGTSVRDIAQEAGVNVAMISYYFGSKEKLMQAVFKLRSSSSKMSMETIINDKTMEPIEKVNIMIDSYVEKMLTNICFNRLIFREQVGNSASIITDLIDDTKLLNLELVKKLIQEGQRKKIFVKHIDIPFVMAMMIGTVTQVLNTQRFVRRVYKMEAASNEEYMDFITKKLKNHLKLSFKAILTYEGK